MGKADRNKIQGVRKALEDSATANMLIVKSLEALTRRFDSHETTVKADFQSFGRKIDELRMWKSKMMGVAAGISVTVSLGAAWVMR